MTHIGQKTPILNGQLPILQTGAEFLVPQVSSTKFAHSAPEEGKVLDVSPNEFIKVQFKSGKIKVLDIMPRYTATKRNSVIQITMDNLKAGDTFQKGQLIAWSKHFQGDGLAIGRNCMMAVMNYLGRSHEDAYIISEEMSNNFITENVIKVPVIIPPGTKILNMISQLNTPTDLDTPLIEFQYLKDVSDYINNFDMLDADMDEEEQSSLFSKGTNTIKRLSPGNEVVDIRIKLNSRKEIDPLLISLWEGQKDRIIKLEKILTSTATTEQEKFVDNIDFTVLKIGGHKFRTSEFEGALVEFYVKKPTALEIGDKMANRYGAKGVAGFVIPKDQTPKSEFSGNIDVFLQPCGLLGRKNTAILKELYIGKIFYFLPKIVQDRLQKNTRIEDIKKLIYQVYDLLDPTDDKEILASIKNKIEGIKPELFKASITQNILNFNYILPPFCSPSFKDIQVAANLIKIPLNEKVFIPELGTWTKTAVPVGVQYMSAMEQLSSD